MKNKVITFLIIITMLVAIIPSNVFARMDTLEGNKLGFSAQATSSASIIGRVLGIFQVIGTITAVAALIIIGMRYMFSSIEEKASMKGIIGYYIIGAILVLATTGVVNFAYKIITGI